MEKKEFSYELGQRIKRQRILQGYTGEGLADKADISSRYLSDVECGKKTPGALVLARLATALQTSVDYLLFGAKEADFSIKQAITRLENELRKLSQEEME